MLILICEEQSLSAILHILFVNYMFRTVFKLRRYRKDWLTKRQIYLLDKPDKPAFNNIFVTKEENGCTVRGRGGGRGHETPAGGGKKEECSIKVRSLGGLFVS